MRMLKWIIRSLRPKPKNIRVRNLLYDMADARQSDKAKEIDLIYRKRRTAQ